MNGVPGNQVLEPALQLGRQLNSLDADERHVVAVHVDAEVRPLQRADLFEGGEDGPPDLEQIGALQGTDFSVHVNSDNVAFVRVQGVELTPELRRRLEEVIARDSIHVGPVRFVAE